MTLSNSPDWILCGLCVLRGRFISIPGPPGGRRGPDRDQLHAPPRKSESATEDTEEEIPNLKFEISN